MDIPKLQDFFLPVLKSIGSRDISSIQEVMEDMKTHFNLTEEQMSRRVSNGTKTMVYDKVTWAMTHLFKADFIEKEGPGRRSIIEKGQGVLSKNPDSLTWKDLKKPSQSQEDPKAGVHVEIPTPKTAVPVHIEDQPPIEVLEKTFESLKEDVLEELLDKVKKIHHRSFEELVLKLLQKMGYGQSETGLQHTGGPGDGGVDGVVFQDPLGCDRIYIQAKRYKGTSVGKPEIQNFHGALDQKSSQKGIFITTSRFTKAVLESTEEFSSRVILIDGKRLAELLYQYNVGVKTEDVFEYKAVDESFFEDFS